MRGPATVSSAERRATCLWLAELASWRAGVISRVVAEYGDLTVALQRPRREIAARLAAGQRRRPREHPQAGGTPGEGAAYEAALARAAPRATGVAPPSGAVVTYVDPDYPESLRHLHDPPPALFVLGGPDTEQTLGRLRALSAAPRVAVVGTRRPSVYGLEMAAGIAADLAGSGCVVASGLALGIDAVAHRGALTGAPSDAPAPVTVAVMACGADVCYPLAHRALRLDVLERGLIVSEFIWGVPARTWRFPARNRIMAALGHALVLVEGGRRSGALITARHALDLGRAVLAVPGESGRQVSEAPHVLLRHGAAICEAGDCVVAALVGVWPSDPGVLWPWVETVLRRCGPQSEPGWWDADELEAEALGRALAGIGERPAVPTGTGGRKAGGAGAAAGRSAPTLCDRPQSELPPEEQAVMALLDAGVCNVDAVVERSGLEVTRVLAALGSLESAGRVSLLPDGGYRVVRHGAGTMRPASG